MIVTMIIAVAYYYFNRSYFLFVKQLKQQPSRIWFVLLSFFLNYLLFVVCSILELHLIFNWMLFAVFLFVETLYYNGKDMRCALFSTLIGIICGLAINIFCRSAIAILLEQPLKSFDNHISSVENLKWIPILIGFLLAGAAMQLLTVPVLLGHSRLILRYPQHQFFLLEIMTGLFFYLFLNLVLYSEPLNDVLLKIWSIKSCLFSTVGLCIAIRYTQRICQLHAYREQNQHIEQEIKKQQITEEKMYRLASHDQLTGLLNRQQAEKIITSMMEQKIIYVLCFLDIDGLKAVNDEYGHNEGDQYILTVSEQIRNACRKDKDWLFRYGGDEFLLLFTEMSVKLAEDRVLSVNNKLQDKETGEQNPYPKSLSYGIVESSKYSSAEDMIQAADQKMYEHKQAKRKIRG